MGKKGGADDSSSREMINMQKEEAEQARVKEAARQDRINKGLSLITEKFTGKNEYKTVQNNPYKVTAPGAGIKSGDAVSGLPAGYKYVQQPGMAGTAGTPASGSMVSNPALPSTMLKKGKNPALPIGPTNPAVANTGGRFTANNLRDLGTSTYTPAAFSGGSVNTGNPNSGGGSGGSGSGYRPGVAGTAATPGKWVVQGPDGKFYDVGSSIDQGSKQVFTGRRSGGIGDDFYNGFKQAILDYYQPQVADKLAQATNETNFRLARSGLYRSTASINAMADLAKQNDINTGQIRNKADQAAADLKTRVENEKAKAVSQLYATENPDVAANQATAAVKNIVAETPDSTPLGDIFNVAAIGGAKFLQGRDNAAFNQRIGAIAKPATRIV